MGDLGVAVVIEDDLDVRNLVEGVFLQSGFVVHTAMGGREGVEAVREKRPDVVTLDVGLPILTVLRCCARSVSSPTLTS
jgi:two-component system OmpR family response regulator